MTTKRYFLMLLDMLGSVTGAKAQESTKRHITGIDQRYSSFELRTLTLDVMHEHDYVRRSDGEKHWLECVSESGVCKEKTKGVENHSIHESILCDTENYTCDVCGYVYESMKAPYDARDYFSLKAMDGEVTLGMQKTGSPDDCLLQVSTDGNIWSAPMTLSETTASIAIIPSGETRYFRRGSTTTTDKISSDYFDNYWSFTMDGSGNIEADGNIMSLLDMTCQKTTMDDNAFTKLFDGCTLLKTVTIQNQALMDVGYKIHIVFTKLFLNCEKLTVAPRMDAITVVPQWGFVSMFAGSGIKTAPALSATHIRDGAYSSMFEDCKDLVSLPKFTATSLNRCAYWDMFKGCDKLTSIEIANIESMVVEEGSTGRENSFHDMLAGTAMETNGVIIAPVEMMGDARIALPSNWQWATKLKLNEDPTAGEEGNFYTTFYDSRYEYIVEDGFKAYSGTITSGDDGDVLRLTVTPNKIIPKGEGVLIHGGSGEVLLTVSNDDANSIESNVLTGSDANSTAPDFCYILSYGQNGLGFYRYAEGNALSAHKAYLVYDRPAGAPAFRMVFEEDEEDGISPLHASPKGEVMIYNLSGMRLDKLQKGINIVNGKKIIVK